MESNKAKKHRLLLASLKINHPLPEPDPPWGILEEITLNDEKKRWKK